MLKHKNNIIIALAIPFLLIVTIAAIEPGQLTLADILFHPVTYIMLLVFFVPVFGLLEGVRFMRIKSNAIGLGFLLGIILTIASLFVFGSIYPDGCGEFGPSGTGATVCEFTFGFPLNVDTAKHGGASIFGFLVVDLVFWIIIIWAITSLFSRWKGKQESHY